MEANEEEQDHIQEDKTFDNIRVASWNVQYLQDRNVICGIYFWMERMRVFERKQN